MVLKLHLWGIDQFDLTIVWSFGCKCYLLPLFCYYYQLFTLVRFLSFISVWHRWHWLYSLLWGRFYNCLVANVSSCWCHWFYPIGTYCFSHIILSRYKHFFECQLMFFLYPSSWYQIPKLLEVVGLAYTLWFTYRYLLFKVIISFYFCWYFSATW